MSAQPAINVLVAAAPGLALRCPVCKGSLTPVDLADATARRECSRCHFVVASQNGVWRALAPVRELHFRRLATICSMLREQEHPDHTAEYYLGLPYRDVSGQKGRQWRLRGRSFSYFESRMLPVLEQRAAGRPLRVLDLGAGNGWLSYRLALRGHECIAIDLLDSAVDGLRAARHYLAQLSRPFACVQAEMDNLPFGAGQFDIAIYNASFHYSEDYARTLREAMRCLRPGGEVVILDTPYYNRDESGRAVVLEKRESLQKRCGFRSDSIDACEYLSDDILARLEHECGLRWRFGRPWYGLKWALRPWHAMLKGHTEPPNFYLISATVGN